MTKFRFTSRSAPLRARLPHSRPSRLTFERLESRRMMAGVVIHEFLASNTAGIADEDGERHDWIELKNLGAEAVDLAGWSLTDTARITSANVHAA
ncbi:MAG TPA: lamin tail domain-containing protein, partial [Lacipirellulaceae bacterium]|nr:lamin tail domain-containing protein [Lacipirellulaceae bacterium]